jgi:hypothetical protein
MLPAKSADEGVSTVNVGEDKDAGAGDVPHARAGWRSSAWCAGGSESAGASMSGEAREGASGNNSDAEEGARREYSRRAHDG